MKNLEKRIITLPDKKFIKEWNELVDRSDHANFFSTYEWYKTCSEVYSGKNFILAIYANGELVGVLTLTREKKFGFDVLTTPGKKYLEKTSLLVRENNPEIIKFLIDSVLDIGSLYLPEVTEEISRVIFRIKPKGLLTLSSINPYIKLDENPHGSLSEKQEKRILSKMKRNIKDLKYGHYGENLDKHINTVMELEKRSTKKATGKDSFSDMKIRNLFRSLIKNTNGNLIISFMYHKNVPFVSSCGLVFKKTYLAYHTSYDPEFKSLIPGKMITYNIINRLASEGINYFDLGRGHNVFKKEFTDRHVAQYDFYYSNNSLLRLWWKSINCARRLKAKYYKNRNSYDNEYLFKLFGDKKNV